MVAIEKTKLFKELKKLDEAFANDVLKNSNSIIELINKKTTINFPNYTNHDIRHSISIINTMYDLIKDNDDFSPLEYALMIYAAIFHDIGMAVDDEEISKIKNNDSKYLYNQNFQLIKENLSNNEQLAIQEVVRNAHGKISNDLITTQYKDLFKFPDRNIYFDEHLGMICQAHTEDKTYLEKIPTEKSKGNYSYNPRFIAILLRVADILDIDDTRTPIELYNSIDLNDFSDEEWQKNFVIENSKKIYKKNKLKEIRLEGTCENIKVHRKLLNYIKWIENELNILVNMTSDMKEEYQITINTEVKNNIESKGYTIPDLKLNMDYHAVTNLLMGEAIYGSKDLGLRELLQNSIDAIMVKKDKLKIENHPLKDSYKPTINIDIDEKNDKVIIKDNGMGMNEHIIKNYFLNVGKSYYKSKDFINYNHNYNPIGNFGIGFLSCFMLSNEVQVVTKYFNHNKKYIIDLEKDSEYIAFKEEEDNNFESGTELILNLKSIKDIFLGDDELELNISEFLRDNILIKDFSITLNKIKVVNEIEKERNASFKIDISKYLKDIEGEIEINQNKYQNFIFDKFRNAEDLVYFNGKNLEKIIDYETLNMTDIISGFNFEYIEIPLLNQNEIDEFEILTDSGYLDNSEALNTIINKQKEKKIIYLVISNKAHYWEPSYYGNYYDNDDYLFCIEENEEEINFNIQNILDFLTINEYEAVGAINVKIDLIYIDNTVITYKKNKYQSNYGNTFIKNIKINHKYDKYVLSDLINVKSINLNIKNNTLTPNVSRTELVLSSQKKLTNLIFKLIHEYALKNFDLSNKEKKLLDIFIKLNYENDSSLEKD